MSFEIKTAEANNTRQTEATVNKEKKLYKPTVGKYLFINIGLIILLEAILLGALFLITPNNFLQAFSPENNNNIDTQKILSLINNERTSYSLPILNIDLKLQAAAQQKALDLMHHQYFNHTSPQGKIFSSWIKSTGYGYLRVGENLAIYFASNERIVAAWMDSDKHRQNVLNPYYTETGIAVVSGLFNDKQTEIIVQIFGQPTDSEQKTNPLVLHLD